jgi:prefoldin alpha subunit
MANEEYIMQLSMIQEEARKLEEQLNIINQQIREFDLLKESLDNIENVKSEKVLTSLGKGVFIESKIESKELLVNIGNNVVLKRSTKETKDIIDKQIRELEKIKIQIEQAIGDLDLELQRILEGAREGHVHQKNP